MDFRYRKEAVPFRDIFPKLVVADVLERYQHFVESADPHERIALAACALWDGGYDEILARYGFHDQHQIFTGHCHQVTPALALVLKAMGFAHVAYLEARRVDRVTRQAIDPRYELDPDVRDEFCAIGRIPYCCLEVEIDGHMLYLSPKHLRAVNGRPTALLTPECYRKMIGAVAHQDDAAKSGVYLAIVQNDPVTWKKQTYKDAVPEYFQTFAHMVLEL